MAIKTEQYRKDKETADLQISINIINIEAELVPMGSLWTDVCCLKNKLLAYLQHSVIRFEENVVHYNITTVYMALVLYMFYFVVNCYTGEYDVWQRECYSYYHDRWKSHYLHFLDAVQNMLKKMAYVIPHCSKILHIVLLCDKDFMLSNYIMYAPCLLCPSQGYLPMVIDWTLPLDSYHSRFSQDLHISHGLPLVEEGIGKHRCCSRVVIHNKIEQHNILITR